MCEAPACRDGAAVGVPADRQAAAVRPFDRVVFEDPVVAAGTRDHAELRKRIRVGGVLKGDALDADEARAALRGNERGLTGGHFDHVVGRRSRGQTDLNGLSRRLHPEARIGRAADLLHDRSAPTPRRQAVLRLGRNREVGDRLQTRRRQFALLFHRLQRLAVDEHQSTPAQKRPHVDRRADRATTSCP